MRGETPIGVAATSMLIIAGTTTLILISIAANTRSSSRREARAGFNMTQSTAKAFRTETRERRKNSTRRVPTTRSNRASSFAAARIKAGRILAAAARAIARAPLIVEVSETVAERAKAGSGTAAEPGIGAELVVWEALVTVVEREVAVAQAN